MTSRTHGGQSTELRELMESKVVHSAGINTVEVIVSSDK